MLSTNTLQRTVTRRGMQMRMQDGCKIDHAMIKEFTDLLKLKDMSEEDTLQIGYNLLEGAFIEHIRMNFTEDNYIPNSEEEFVKRWNWVKRQEKLMVGQKNSQGKGKKNLQQFSTPPTIALFVAVCALSYEGAILEPSAGTGMLVAPFHDRAQDFVLNEIDDERFNLLNDMFPNASYISQKDALQLSCHAFGMVSNLATILMNPPFSANVDIPSKHNRTETLKHFKDALRFLAPGGRIVIITGLNTTGRELEKVGYNQVDWKATYKFDGKFYSRMGTTFPFAVHILDDNDPHLPENVIRDDFTPLHRRNNR